MIFGKKRGPATELIGQRFGRLTVVSWVSREHRQNMWKCLCVCGSETVARSGCLKQGRVKSCGCFLTDFNKNHPRWKKKQYTNTLDHFYGKTLASFGLHPALGGRRPFQKAYQEKEKTKSPLWNGVRKTLDQIDSGQG